jgi:hypothetical protein
MHSAGGKHFKVNSGKLQFLVREPCTMPGQRYKILKGVLREDEHISIISEMDEGRIYIDGPKVSYPMPAGLELTARISEKKLTIFL